MEIRGGIRTLVASTIKIVVEVLAVALLVFGIYYLVATLNDSSGNLYTQADEDPFPRVEWPDSGQYTSKLWPDLAFDTYSDWQIEESTDYDTSKGAGYVDGQITIRGGGATLTFSMNTITSDNIEVNTCFTKDQLSRIKQQIYGWYEGGTIKYVTGYTSQDSEWSTISGESPSYRPGHNFCETSPSIGIYSSTVKKSDHSGTDYGDNNNTYALVWVGAEARGSLDLSKKQIYDYIVLSMSPQATVR